MVSKRKQILAIDDIQDNLISLKALLYEAFPDIEFIQALDGKSGYELALANNPDVVLLDIVMPEMDGFEVCRIFKADSVLNDIPIVFLTALKGDRESRMKALELGAEAFLAKPIDIVELTAQINAMIKIKEANYHKRNEKEILKNLVELKTHELNEAHIKTKSLLEELRLENEARKQTEHILRNSENKFKQISSLTSDIAYSCIKPKGSEYSLDWMTGAVDKITGYSLEEIFARKCWKFLVLDDDLSLFNKHVIGLVAGQTDTVELRVKQKNGDIRWLKSFAHCINDTVDTSKLRLYGGLVDITLSKEYTEEIRLSEEKFALAFKSSSYAISISRASDGKIIEFNDSFERITGYSKHELTGQSTVGLKLWVNEYDREYVVNEVIKGNQVAGREFQFRTKSGNIIIGLMSCEMITIQDEPCILSSINDITDRKKIQDALSESETLYKKIINTSPDGIAVALLDGTVLTASEKSYKMWGYDSESDIIGRNILDFVDPVHHDKAKFRVSEMLKGNLTGPAEYLMVKKDGRRFYCEVNADILRDARNNPTSILFIERDITERKLFEKELIESENKFRLAFRTSPDAVTLNRVSDGKYLEINDGFTTITGYTEEDALGKTSLELKIWNNLEERQQLVNTLTEKGYAENLEAEFKSKDGKIITGLMSARIIEIDDEKTILSITRDITFRKQAEKQLKLANTNWDNTFNAIQDCIAILDSEQTIVHCNKAFLTLLNTRIEDIAGQKCFNHVHKLDCPVDNCPFIRMGISGIREQTEMIINGKYYNILVDPIYNENDEVIGAVHIMTDISNRKLIEHALQRSENRFKLLIDRSPATITLIDSKTSFIYSSPTAFKMFGYTPEELNLLHLNELMHPDDHIRILPSLNEMMEKSGRIVTLQYRFRHKDRSWLWIESTFTNLLHEPAVEAIVINIADINEKYEAEQMLRESEEKYKTLIEISQDALFINENDKITYINPAALKLFGAVRAEQIVGKSPFEIFHPDYHEIIRQRIKIMLEKGEPVKLLEEKIIKLDKTVTEVEVSAIPFLLKGQRAIQVVLRDISERKKTEEALLESEKRYQAFINTHNDLMFVKDEHFRYIVINDATAQFFGKSKEEMLFKTDFELMDEAPALQCQQSDLKALMTGSSVVNEELVGNQIFESTKFPISLKDNKTGIGAIIRNITDRKKNDLIREIQFDIAEAVVTSKNIDELFHVIRNKIGKLVDTTNFMLAFYDDKSDIISLPFSIDLKTNNPKTVPASRSLTGKVVKQKKPLRYSKEDIRIMAENNEIDLFGARAEIWLGIPLIHIDRTIGALILQNYDDPYAYDEDSIELLQIIANQLAIYIEKKKDEAELIIAKEKAEESDRLKTAFLNNMSHEIRTPLNGITGFTTVLSDPETTYEDIETYSPLITSATDQLCTIIDDIICIATIEAGQEILRETPFDINDMMKELYNEFSNKPDKSKIILNYRTQLNSIQSKVLADETKLNKILRNLLSNAMKFTSEGLIEFNCEIKEDGLYFCVKDSGIGIPPKYHELIFDRFRQIKPERDREYGGNGLGLAISKAYVEMMGGKIWLDSELGKGSIFHFTIAYQPIIQHIEIKRIEETLNDEFRIFENKTVLVAEDEWSNYMLIEKLLEPYKFNIIHVLTGIEAVDSVRKNPGIDLILMDLKMPDMDGFEATRIIKKEFFSIPVIAVTAYALSGDMEKAFDAGCDDYISKPIKINKLVQKIKILMDAKKYEL